MMIEKTALKPLLIACCLSLLAACSSNDRTTVESDLNINHAPDWVNVGTQTVDNHGGKLIHGVGMSEPIADESLQKSVADNRALAEVARVLSTSVYSMQKDVTSTTNSGDVNAKIQREINAKTQLALNGAKIIGRWKDPENGAIYSFAELDLSDLDASIERATQLGSKQAEKLNAQ